MNSQITNQINQAGHLTIGGVDSLKLAKEYGTPLVVYDVSQIRNQIRAFKKVFEEEQVNYAVSYASKAFASIAMYQVANEEGAYTHVGKIIIDNFYEIDLLRQVLEEQDSKINVMLRITPGISAHTHEYDQTGQVDSKFGFDLKSGQADKALQEVLKNQRMHMLGIHAHIGSQIFELNGFEMAAAKLVDVAASWKEKYDYTAQIINVGGGFGIKYVQEDHPLKPEEFVKAIVKAIKDEATKHNFPIPEIDIEPGRSIVGPAGYNLYKVGSMKEIPGLVPYVSVDGGMGDNIRPALYQAKYETVLANDPQRRASQEFHVAGKYCESGDILADAKLPSLKAGDILAMLDTGAYGYSMASNYNRNPRPAVVFVENGKEQLVIKRESLEDLIHLDQDYNI